MGYDRKSNILCKQNIRFKMGVTSHVLREWRSLGRRLALSRPAIGVLSAGDWRSLQRRSTLLSLLSLNANNLSLSFYTSRWSGDGLKISGDGCASYQKFYIPLHSITVLECFRITFR